MLLPSHIHEFFVQRENIVLCFCHFMMFKYKIVYFSKRLFSVGGCFVVIVVFCCVLFTVECEYYYDGFIYDFFFIFLKDFCEAINFIFFKKFMWKKFIVMHKKCTRFLYFMGSLGKILVFTLFFFEWKYITCV